MRALNVLQVISVLDDLPAVPKETQQNDLSQRSLGAEVEPVCTTAQGQLGVVVLLQGS